MEYRRCNRCLMDTEADANIIFDKDGNCKYCTEALAQIHTKPISRMERDNAVCKRP